MNIFSIMLHFLDFGFHSAYSQIRQKLKYFFLINSKCMIFLINYICINVWQSRSHQTLFLQARAHTYKYFIKSQKVPNLVISGIIFG